ncbi:MAG: hypothetical protein IJC02_08765 [Lachnospiraceae bacterium]|nr:hypothetical protein [Lachnospiraceae bacterium]MBQ3191269.1 hypothetical protein [Bacteroides sp.]MBQ4590062.1 hypothetical protein [Bacteroidaceae bacterium]
MAEEKIIKEQLMKLLETYYDGSFSRMACEYIRTTGMAHEEVEELLEAMKKG